MQENRMKNLAEIFKKRELKTEKMQEDAKKSNTQLFINVMKTNQLI